jgi:VIT1/CCC1 family predicted Fe2+/Mn2+ transporter
LVGGGGSIQRRVVSGIHGADVSRAIVLAGGLAELLGGTISMGLGAYLATKSQAEYVRAERAREEREVDEIPEEERNEVRVAYANQGFHGEVLDKMVAHVTADRARWIATMMREELGLDETPLRPVQVGAATGLAYAMGAAVPTLPYALPISTSHAFELSIGVTIVTLFAVGAVKTLATGLSWWRSGAETLFIGALAGAVTFAAGTLIAGAR